MRCLFRQIKFVIIHDVVKLFHSLILHRAHEYTITLISDNNISSILSYRNHILFVVIGLNYYFWSKKTYKKISSESKIL